jgi:hypothetical protein
MFHDGTGVNVSAQDAKQYAQQGVEAGQNTKRQMDDKQMMMLQSLDNIVKAFGKAGPSDVAAFHAADTRSRMFNTYAQQMQDQMTEKQKQDDAYRAQLMGTYGHNVPGSSSIPSAFIGVGNSPAQHADYLASRGVSEYGTDAKNSGESIELAKQKERDNLNAQTMTEMAKIKSLLSLGLASSAQQQTFTNLKDVEQQKANLLGLNPLSQAAQIKADNVQPKPAKPDSSLTKSLETMRKMYADATKRAKEEQSKDGRHQAQQDAEYASAKIREIQAAIERNAPSAQGSAGAVEAAPAIKDKLTLSNPDHVAVAQQLMQEAGGDPAKARELAKARGLKF